MEVTVGPMWLVPTALLFWSAIEPHVSALLEAGFSFYCVGTDGEGDDESAREMLSDWGWAADRAAAMDVEGQCRQWVDCCHLPRHHLRGRSDLSALLQC